MSAPPTDPSRGEAVPGLAAVEEWLGSLAGAGLDDAARVERIRALEVLKSRCAALQARLSVDLDASQRARHAELGVPPAHQGRGVAAQVGLARRESPNRGAVLLGLAKALVGEMPHTFARLASGDLSEYDALLLARETACLSASDRRAVDERLCADPATARGWGHRRIAAEARRLGYALDPHAAVDKAAKARAERRVTLRPAPDTMTWLTALLPVEEGVAAHAALTRAAEAARKAGDERGRGQVMADTLVERLTGQASAGAVPIAVNLTVSDQTLLGGGHEPAWLGDVPVPAGLARPLAARAVEQSRATLRRLYAEPGSGTLVAMDARSRRFPKGLARWIDLRDRSCRTPWCDAPIRHHDHARPWAAGGTTSSGNGQGLCVACNHAKQAPGWRAGPDPGSDSHRVVTTSPTGHDHRSAPPRAPVPSPLVPARSHVEWAVIIALADDYPAA